MARRTQNPTILPKFWPRRAIPLLKRQLERLETEIIKLPHDAPEVTAWEQRTTTLLDDTFGKPNGYWHPNTSKFNSVTSGLPPVLSLDFPGGSRSIPDDSQQRFDRKMIAKGALLRTYIEQLEDESALLSEDASDGSLNKAVPPELEALPRKETLLSDLKTRLEEQNPFVSLLFIDLDNFKGVNDQLGHVAGDKCLTRVANVMRGVLSGKGTLYRYGGDEFCALLPNFSTTEAAGTAERIRAAIDAENPGDSVKVTCSIGVASSQTDDLNNADEILKAADDAMYISKNGTKNSVSIYASCGAKADTGSQPGTTLLHATPESFDVSVTAGYDPLVVLLTNHADEAFQVVGVTVEWNGAALGKMHRPPLGTVWHVPAKERLEIRGPDDGRIVIQLINLKGQHHGWFQEFIDFVFQCSVAGKPQTFRKRTKVQVDPVNRHFTQL